MQRYSIRHFKKHSSKRFKKIKRYRSPFEKKLCFLSIVCIIITMITLLIIDAKVRPILKSVASSKANNIAMQAINDAVTTVLSDTNISYEDLTEFMYDEDHKISAINTNIAIANTLEANIEKEISKTINDISEKKVSIPIGSIIGGNILSGRGPRLKLYITLAGNTKGNIVNAFESAGINQTRHQVQLKLETKIYVIMTGMNTSTVVNSNITIAETILVGIVPETYANIEKNE